MFPTVIATKYTTNYKAGPGSPGIMANYTGNSTKSLHMSVKASLEKLQTDYIDLLYVHWWDYSTSIPELMQSLNTLVTQGKVLYLGISDTPAWVVRYTLPKYSLFDDLPTDNRSKSNEYARNHGLRQFCVYQGRWSAATRDFERDIIPMCREERMGLCPWGSLGGGHLRSEALDGRSPTASDNEIKVSETLDIIAKRKNTLLTSVALAYVMHKAPYVFPVVGIRKPEHLQGSIEAVGIELSEEDIKDIESAAPFALGFPHNMLWREGVPKIPNDIWLLGMGGNFDYVPLQQAIKPSNMSE